MPDDNRDKVQQLISKGAELTGAAAGGGLGFFAAGPVGAAAGALAGTLLGQMLEIGGEMCHRALSTRETKRVGASLGFTAVAIQERLDQGERPRDDGFFTRDETSRSAAEELFEGVLLKCKNEHEEKKLRFISNIFAHAAFNKVSAADANAVLLLSERPSYRQICILAAFGGVGKFLELMRFTDIEKLVERLKAYGRYPLADDVIQLNETFRLIGGPVRPLTETADLVGLTAIGEMCFNMMSLGDIPSEDVAGVVSQFEAALKPS